MTVDPLTKTYVYTSNNGHGTISAYALNGAGALTLLNPKAANMGRTNDLAVALETAPGSTGSSFLYALDAQNGTVVGWHINSDGSLTLLGSFGGLSSNAGAQGLVAY